MGVKGISMILTIDCDKLHKRTNQIWTVKLLSDSKVTSWHLSQKGLQLLQFLLWKKIIELNWALW